MYIWLCISYGNFRGVERSSIHPCVLLGALIRSKFVPGPRGSFLYTMCVYIYIYIYINMYLYIYIISICIYVYINIERDVHIWYMCFILLCVCYGLHISKVWCLHTYACVQCVYAYVHESISFAYFYMQHLPNMLVCYLHIQTMAMVASDG